MSNNDRNDDPTRVGKIPGAPPTSPGGMSKRTLADELVTKHGYGSDQIVALSWDELIDSVIEQRRAREIEAGVASIKEAHDSLVRDLAPGYDDITLPDDGTDWTDVSHRPTGRDMFPDDEIPTVDDTFTTVIGYVVEDESGTDSADDLLADLDSLLGDEGSSEDLPDDYENLLEDLDEAREEEQSKKPSSLLHKITGVRDYVFNGHMGAGPSSSERWINCTASLGASRQFLETLSPNQQVKYAESSTAARQGTTAHAAAETQVNLMLGNIEQDEADTTLLELAIHPDTSGEAYDDEMAERITEYVDLIQQYAHDRGEENVLVEGRVSAVIPLTDLHEGETYEIHGSLDAGVLPTNTEKNLAVVDFKYGNGIDVEVEDNSQTRIYALGLLDLLTDEDGNLITDVETVTYYIVQPRLGGIKTFTENLDDLFDWRDDVLSPALTKALYGVDEGATYEPSDSACQFCPARGSCSALAEQRVAAAQDLFDVVADPGEFSVGALSEERLGSLLAQAQGIAKITDDLKDEAQRRLHRGERVPGYHLVNYSPPRYWAEDAENALDPMLHHDEGAVLSSSQRVLLWTQPKVVSPAQALAILKKNGVEDADKVLGSMIVVPEKKPVVAPVDDRRKAWEGKPPEAMFPDLEGES